MGRSDNNMDYSGFAHGAQGGPSKDHGVKRRSIFYDLPYFGVSILFFL